MRTLLKTLLLLGIIAVVVIPVALYHSHRLSPMSWQLLEPDNHDKNLMLKGYDAVAYFNDGEAIKGNPNLGLKWNERIWYFASEANRLSFKTFPDKYAPQYGGYCASAVASGLTFDVDPGVWHIENGRLYLFYSPSARQSFLADSEAAIARAGQHWSAFKLGY